MKQIALILALMLALILAPLRTSSTAQAFHLSSSSFSSATRNSKSPSICDVDTIAAPQMGEFAKRLPSLCKANYTKIKGKLIADSFQPPGKVHLIFKNDLLNPAETLGNKVFLSSSWFTKHPEDLGAIVHELTHVVQSYSGDQPFWVVEGIADYIRFWRGYSNSSSYSHCGEGSDHYTSGYWCSAAFLQYVEKNYDSKIIAKLNKAMRENTYDDGLFARYTGKNLEQLWQKCREKDCKGGRP